ncbi:hypothetical protein E6W39_32380 [Kitasatospora acidiphila]|uniref:Uncharacterized protein n=1 Tax=Kitasatospora acidiphila TaxID=2567942 RepID=A0A540WAP6_9ACTN|nr:hypothetical protein E6W39_32380 [Kitasatospora acidiphila]
MCLVDDLYGHCGAPGCLSGSDRFGERPTSPVHAPFAADAGTLQTPRKPVGEPRRPPATFLEAVQETEEVVPVNAVSTWVLPSGATVGR